MAAFGGLSGGSVFVTLGAHALREGFVQYERDVSAATKIKSHHVRLGGDFIKDGFERYFQANREGSRESEIFRQKATAAYGSVDKAMAAMGLSATKNLGLTREQLGYTAHEFETVAAAAQHTADAQTSAMAQGTAAIRKGATEQEAALGRVAHASEASAKKAKASWTKGFDSLANAGKYTALGSALIGGIGVKMAADFQKHMELVHTQAGDTNKEVKLLSGNLLDLAGNVGVGPKQLADGLYHVASAAAAGGSHIKGASQQLHVLEVAAKGARSGNDDLVSVTNALTGAMNSFHRPASEAAAVMGQLDRIAGQGNMTMKELTGAMTTGILGAAKAVGLELRDVGAALDTLTQRGVPAQEGATRLRTVLGLIANPTDKAKKAIAELGFTSTTMAEDFRKKGLIGALQDLRSHLDKTFGRKLTTEEHQAALKKYQQTLIDAGVTGKALDRQVKQFSDSLDKQGEGAIKSSQLIAQAFGGARMGTTMQILMQNIDSVQSHTKSLTRSTASDTALFNKHWKETQTTFSQQVAEMWAGLQALLIRVGNKLIPVIQDAIKVINNFGDWLHRHKTTAEVLAITLGTLLTGAVVAFIARLVKGMAEGTMSVVRFVANIDKIPGAFGRWLKGLADIRSANVKTEESTNVVTDSIVAQGRAANATAEAMGRLAMTEEEVSAGGVIMPRGASRGGISSAARGGAAGAGRGAAAEGAVATGGFRAGFSRLGGRAMGGAGIFLGGQILSDMVGTLGKGGKAIGSAIGGAAKGAGIGMLFGPEGAVGGAVIGGLIGSIGHFLKHDGPSEGEKMAKVLGKPLKNLPVTVDRKKYLAEVDQARKDIQQHLDHAAKTAHPSAHGTGPALHPFGPDGPVEYGPSKQQLAQARREQEQAGRIAAKAFTDGYQKGWKYFDPGHLIHDFEDRFNNVPASTRNAGAQSVIEWAHGMEKEGRLPKHATEKLIKDLESLYPGLRAYLKAQGEGSQKDLTETFKDRKLVDAVAKQIGDIHHLWQGAPVLARTTAANVRDNWVTETQALREQLKHAHGQQRQDLEVAYKKLVALSGDAAGKVQAHWVNNTATMTTRVGKNIGSMMQAFSDGMANIESNTNVLAKVFNIPLVKAKIESKKIHTNVQAAAAAGHDTSVGLHSGGVVPGAEYGRDDHMTLVDPSGKPRARMAGDEWIFNRDQQPLVQLGLQMLGFGGAEELWGGSTYGHTAFAKGGDLGRVPRFARGGAGNGYVFPFPKGVKFSWQRVDQGQDLQAPPGTPIEAIAPGVISIAHDRFGGFGPFYPTERITDGPLSGRSLYYGHAKTTRTGRVQAGDVIGVTQSRANSWTAAPAGWLELGFLPYGSMTAGNAIAPILHSLAGSGSFAAAGNIGLGNIGTGIGISMPTIPTPHISGSGPLHGILQGALKRTTKGANAYVGGVGPGGLPMGTYHGTLDRIFPSHRVGTPGVRLDPKDVRMLAVKAGLPGDIFEKIAHGESDYQPGVISNDGGYGLWQMTPRVQSQETISAWHRIGSYFNPWKNALQAKYLYDRAPSKIPRTKGFPWFGTKFLARGGSLAKTLQQGGTVSGRPPAPPKVTPKRQPGVTVPVAPRPKTSHTSATSSTNSYLHHLTGHQSHHAGIHLPAPVSHLLGQLDDPTLIDQTGGKISDLDTLYQNTDRFDALAHGELGVPDFQVLLGIRGEQGTLLGEQLGQAQTSRQVLGHEARVYGTRATRVRHQATNVASRINRVKEQIKHQTRAMARNRHRRSGKLLKLADDLARKVSKNADAQARVRDAEIAIRKKYTDRIAAVPPAPPPPTAQAQAIRRQYQTMIDNEPTTAGKKRIQKRRDAALNALASGHRAAVHAHGQRLKNLNKARQDELAPLRKHHNQLTDEVRHLRRDEAAHRRKYQHQGWSQIWAMTTKKWKLQDKLQHLEDKEYQLSGARTHVGKGGELGQLDAIVKGIDTGEGALDTEIGTIETAQQTNVLDQVDLADQAAQTLANTSGKDVDAAQFLNSSTLKALEGMGFAKDGFHRIFHPDPSSTAEDVLLTPDQQKTLDTLTESEALAGLTPTVDDDRSARLGLRNFWQGILNTLQARHAPPPLITEAANTLKGYLDDIAGSNAVTDLQAMDSASQQIFSQFGSNFVAAAPGPLAAALAGAGTASAPGVRYFGAAGPSDAVDAGLTPEGTVPAGATFNQHNYYQTGPEDPHVHAQVSLTEFKTAFG